MDDCLCNPVLQEPLVEYDAAIAYCSFCSIDEARDPVEGILVCGTVTSTRMATETLESPS